MEEKINYRIDYILYIYVFLKKCDKIYYVKFQGQVNGESIYKYDYFGIVVFFVILVKFEVLFYINDFFFESSIVYQDIY